MLPRPPHCVPVAHITRFDLVGLLIGIRPHAARMLRQDVVPEDVAPPIKHHPINHTDFTVGQVGRGDLIAFDRLDVELDAIVYR